MASLKQILLDYLNAPDWAASQAYLEAHQLDLFTYPALQLLDEMIRAAGSLGDKQILHTHRALIQQAQQIGIGPAYEEFLAVRAAHPGLPLLPVHLTEVIKHLATLSPARMKAWLESHPEVREQLMELGLLQQNRPAESSLDQVILAFINARSWPEKQRIAEQNPVALFSAGTVIFFEAALRRALGNPVDTLVLEAHQRLLTRCQEIGIPAAFAEAEAALQAAKDAGYDTTPPR
jgi:hypothetical protein